MRSIISTKRKHYVFVCATRNGINSANLWGHNRFTAARNPRRYMRNWCIFDHQIFISSFLGIIRPPDLL